MTAARVTIRSVKMKAGGEVRLLRNTIDPVRKRVDEGIRQALDAQGAIDGYALVVWGPEGSTAAQWAGVDGRPIPTILIPDFVRNRLLAATVESWVIDTVNDQ